MTASTKCYREYRHLTTRRSTSPQLLCAALAQVTGSSKKNLFGNGILATLRLSCAMASVSVTCAVIDCWLTQVSWCRKDRAHVRFHLLDLVLRVINGLSSSVIDFLHAEHGHDSDVGLAYIYLDYKEQSVQKFRDIVPSMLKQLILCRRSCFSKTLELYEELLFDEYTKFDRILSLLKEVSRDFQKVYFVIDALDESDEVEGTREDLITLLGELQAISPKCRILVTSRPKQAAVDRFQNALQLELMANEMDIRPYLEMRTRTEYKIQRQVRLRPYLVTDILDAVTSKCERVFLLAKFHMGSVARARTLADLEEALRNLPDGHNGLLATYSEAMQRIQSQDRREVRLAERILAWLSFSARPLKADELRWALAIDLSKPEKDLNERRLLPEEDIVAVCAGLVSIDPGSKDVRLAHYTTQEFFLSQREKLFPWAKVEICLSYI